MPKPYPREFREDVVAVARKGEDTIAQIAKGFGIAASCLPWDTREKLRLAIATWIERTA